MSKLVIPLAILFVSCTCESRALPADDRGDAVREVDDDPPDEVAEEAPPAGQPGPAATTVEPPAEPPARPPSSGTVHMPAHRQADLERLFAGLTVEPGWTVGTPQIVGEGGQVFLRVEKGRSAVVAIMTPAEQATAGEARSESFAIRIGNMGVEDSGELTRISTAVIDAIQQNDRGGFWETAP